MTDTETIAMSGLTPPQVVLVTPHYGNVSMGWHNTLNKAVRDRRAVHAVREACCSSSVLPLAFNQCLAVALNLRDEGVVTHMAMVHSDIIASPGWLDLLWSEMWTHNLDLISAVVPIKGPAGRTSTAIGSEDDPWVVKRCFFDRDRKRYPLTFTAKDVCRDGEVLLVNTALFLADLRRPWWDNFAFQLHSRVVKKPDGYIAECRSEDWEMSHHLHKAGAKYAATWKPKLFHEGNARYPNYDEGLIPAEGF